MLDEHKQIVDGEHRVKAMVDLYSLDKDIMYVDESCWFWDRYATFNNTKYKNN